jgi:hypothetical protein
MINFVSFPLAFKERNRERLNIEQEPRSPKSPKCGEGEELKSNLMKT